MLQLAYFKINIWFSAIADADAEPVLTFFIIVITKGDYDAFIYILVPVIEIDLVAFVVFFLVSSVTIFRVFLQTIKRFIFNLFDDLSDFFVFYFLWRRNLIIIYKLLDKLQIVLIF